MNPSGPSLAEAVRAATAELAAAGVETPALDARPLAADAFGLPLARILVGSEDAPASGLATLRSALARRVAGEPVARILGRREFWGLEFTLAPETLAPRPDTETVVEAAIALIPKDIVAPRLLDLGTGSGCILLALLSELPGAYGVGVDLSPGAAAAARANARALGLADRAGFFAGRWADALGGDFDLVVSNPPYIESGDIAGLEREVRLHDPALALDGGPDGLDAYREIVMALPRQLRPEGVAVLEHGVGQGDAVAALARAAGLQVVEMRNDLSGRSRTISLRRAAAG